MARLGPLPDAPRCVKIRLIGQNNSVPWVNVMHMQWNNGGTIPTTGGLGTMATAIRTSWAANFAPLFCNTSSLTAVELTDVSSRTGNQSTDTTTVLGTSIQPAAPLQTAAVISWTIARRYRGGHPRTYFAGVDTSRYTLGRTWTAAAITAYSAAAQTLRSTINGLTADGNVWAMVNVSYYHTVGGLAAYKVPPDIDVITGLKFHTRVDTQRRRLGKETS